MDRVNCECMMLFLDLKFFENLLGAVVKWLRLHLSIERSVVRGSP